MNISDIRSLPILSLASCPTFAEIHGCSPLLHFKTRLSSRRLRFHRGRFETVRPARIFWAAIFVFVFASILNV